MAVEYIVHAYKFAEEDALHLLRYLIEMTSVNFQSKPNLTGVLNLLRYLIEMTSVNFQSKTNPADSTSIKYTQKTDTQVEDTG
jgi:hypothetical protein